MRARLEGNVIAESDDIVELRTEWLEKADKTDSDRACPHGVQFYDVVIDGARHARAAWSYEAPLPRMKQVADRFGFWKDVEVG